MKTYQIRVSAVLDQPTAFALKPIANVASLLRSFPPSTPFQIRIGGEVRLSGVIGPAEPAPK